MARRASLGDYGGAAQNLDLCWRQEDPAASEKIYLDMLTREKELAAGDPGFRIELLTQIARAEAAQGKLIEARARLDESEKLLGELLPQVPIKAKIRHLLEEGRFYTLSRTPSQARMRFSAAWPLAVNAGEDSFVIEIARMMAEIESMKLQEEWIRKAIEVAENSKQEAAQRWLGDLYADLGWRLFELRQFDSALKAHQSSLENYQHRTSQPGIFRARWAIGRLLRQLGRYSDALAWNEVLALEMGMDVPVYGRLCEEIAECLLSLKRPVEAQDFFARAHRELSRDTWVPDRHPLRLKRLKDMGKVE